MALPMHASQIAQVMVIALMAVAVVVKVTAQGRRGIRAIVISGWWEACMVTVFWAWLALVLVHGLAAWAWLFGPALFESTVMEYAGIGLVAVGAAMAMAAFRAMGRSWRIGIDKTAREKLVTTGVFAVSRNPIFLFFDLLAVGMLLMSQTLFFLISAPIIILATHIQILKEEQHLRETVGPEYVEYCARVNRYLGVRSPHNDLGERGQPHAADEDRHVRRDHR